MIRLATPQDAVAMQALMQQQAHLVVDVPNSLGARRVLAAMDASRLEANMVGGRFSYWIQEEASCKQPVLQGLIGLRDGQHLHHLFVREDLHRQGIARALWLYAMGHWPSGWPVPIFITVNASLYGLPAYQALGFEPVGPQSKIDGISFVSMKKAVGRVFFVP